MAGGAGMGYKRLITYIMAGENGASLKAANYRLVGETRGGSWSRESRPRVEDEDRQVQKTLWEIR